MYAATRFSNPERDQSRRAADTGKNLAKGQGRTSTTFSMMSAVPARAGTALIIKPGEESLLQQRIALVSEDSNELIQEIKLRMGQNTCVVGMYAGPQTSGKKVGEVLINIHRGGIWDNTIWRHKRKTHRVG